MMLKVRFRLVRWLLATAVFAILIIGSQPAVMPVFAGECVAASSSNCTT